MTQIRMTPTELKTKAQTYGRGSEQVNDVLTQLARLQDQLRAEWEGAAFEKFQMQFDQLRPKVEQFSELLREIQTQLEKTAAAVEHTDQELSKNFGLQ